MAQQRFPSPNLIQGSIGPASAGTVSVPLQDPALAAQSDLYGTLAQRFDQVASMGFKIAGKQAKAAGAAFGAKNAPTAEQVKLAASSGQPIQMPGDASSLKIFDQAAYASSLSVTENYVEIAGRRALTTAFAEAAADPDMDPQSFTAKLDSVITEYSNTLSTLSASSAAKVNASLSIVANSQVVGFSREYMAKQIKAAKDGALQSAGEITETDRQLILGHSNDGEAGVLDKIKLGETKIRNHLESHGIRETQIKTAIKNHRKAMSKAKVDAILGWTITSEFAQRPNQAIKELLKFADPKDTRQSQFPKYARDIWKTMDASQRLSVIGELQKQSAIFNENRRNINQENTDTNKAIEDKSGTDFFDAFITNDRAAMKKQIEIMKVVNPTKATSFQRVLDADPGVVTDNQGDIEKLDGLLSTNSLTYDSISKSKISRETKGDYFEKIRTQRDRLVNQARAIAQTKYQPNLALPPRQLVGDIRINRLKYDRVMLEVINRRTAYDKEIATLISQGKPLPAKPFDFQTFTDNAIKKIDLEENERENTRLRGVVDDLYDFLPEGFGKNKAGLLKASTDRQFGEMLRSQFRNGVQFLKKLRVNE